MKTKLSILSLVIAGSLLAACDRPADVPSEPLEPVANGATVASPAVEAEAVAEPEAQAERAPVDEFISRISQHCGESFGGRIIANEPAQDDDAFEGQDLVMHVLSCTPEQVLIPFHVGDDHSRTWVLTRTDDGLRLKHDHRNSDGSDEDLTMYGGESATAGTATRQEFPVDADSIAMFEAGGINASTTNTWAMEIEPEQRFVYELARPGGRLFQVEFDLTNTVPTPPLPWGSEQAD